MISLALTSRGAEGAKRIVIHSDYHITRLIYTPLTPALAAHCIAKCMWWGNSPVTLKLDPGVKVQGQIQDF